MERPPHSGGTHDRALLRTKTGSATGWNRRPGAPSNEERKQLTKSLSANSVDTLWKTASPIANYDIVWDTLVSEVADNFRAGATDGSIYLREIDPGQKKALVDTLRQHATLVVRLHIEDSSLFTIGSNDSFVRVLEQLVSLQEFSLRNCDVFDKLSSQILNAVRGLEHLRKLSLVRVGCTKGISEDLRVLCQTSVSLESIAIREDNLTEQIFGWTVPSALAEIRTSVSYYLRQNRQLRVLRGGVSPREQPEDASSASSSSSSSPLSSSLSLNSRRLEQVPQILFKSEHLLARLTNLDLSNNALASLTDSFGMLQNLVHLDLSCNQLSVLPTSLVNLTRLEHLNLSHNELLELSESVGMLQNLKYFNVTCNRLRTLPLSLACLPHLREVYFLDFNGPTNRLIYPQEVLEGGSLSLLTHLKYDLKRTVLYDVMPFFFLGLPGSGKTRLIHVLSHGSQMERDPSVIRRKYSGVTESPRGGLFYRTRKGSHHALSLSSDTHSGASSDSTDAPDDTCMVDISSFRITESSSGLGPRVDASGEALGSRTEVTIEAWDFTGQDLIPLFQRDFTNFVCCVNVASERFSAASVLKTLQCVFHHPGTRILIVGTFLDSLSSARMSVVESELDKVAAIVPMVSERVLVSLKGDAKIARKHVREALLRMLRDSPVLTTSVPATWLLLDRMLAVLGEARTVPVLSWQEMVEVATKCQIPQEKVVKACTFIHQTGHITFSENIGDDFCLISSSWIAAMWSPLRLLQSNPEHRGLVSADELVLAWQAMSCPTWATRPWVGLLKRLKMVLPLPRQRLLVVPLLLGRTRPTALESFWPTHCSADQMQFSRIYSLSDPVVDDLFFSQLIVRLLRGNWKANCVWRSGLCLTSDQDEILLIEGTSASSVIKVHLRNSGGSSQLISVIFLMTTLISEHVPGATVTVQVPCIHCLQAKSYDPYMFSREELEDAVANGKGVVLCRSVNPIQIHSMAPDISMAGIAGHTVESSELSNLELIGEGGFAKVYKAVWRGSEVALKQLLPTRESASSTKDEQRRNLFSDLRREAWLMSGLEHPNLVILMGVCLEPFGIVMEYVNAGTLTALLHNDAIPGKFPTALAVKIALDVAKGMEFLHGITPPIVHRDLKSPNILLHSSDGSHTTSISSFGLEARSLAQFPINVSKLVAKVSDFGLSVESEMALEVSGSVVDNPTWSAPEMLSKKKYSGKVDVYSFGVILWEMLTREFFFGHIKFMSELEDMIRAGQRPDIPQEAPLPYKILVGTCWAQDPTKRPSFSDVRKVLSKLASDFGISDELAASSDRLMASSGGSGALRRTGGSSLSRMASGSVSLTNSAGIPSSEAFCEEFEGPQELMPLHDSSVLTLAIVEPHLWSGSSRGEILVWDLQTRVLIHQYVAPSVTDSEGQSVRKPGITAIHSLHHTVWTGHSDGSICVWSRDLKLLKQVKKHPDSVTYIGSEGSDVVVTAGLSGAVRRWNIHNFKFSSLDLPFPVVCMVQMGVNYVLGSGNNLYVLFPDKSYVCAPQHHTSAIHAVVLVRDMIWSASSDKSICVWRLGQDARSLEHVRVLHGHSSRVFCLATDPLGDLVFSGSWDKSIMVWNVTDFRFVGKLRSNHSDAVSQVLYVNVNGADHVMSSSMDRSIISYRRKTLEDGVKTVEEIALQREIDYAQRRRLLERKNSIDSRLGEAPLSPGEDREDMRYLDLLTPAERQYLLQVKNGGSKDKGRGRRGSMFGSDLSPPVASPTKAVRSTSRIGMVAALSNRSSTRSSRSESDASASSLSGSPAQFTIMSRASGTKSGRVSPRPSVLDRQSSTPPRRTGARPRSATIGADRMSSGEDSPFASSPVSFPLASVSPKSGPSPRSDPPSLEREVTSGSSTGGRGSKPLEKLKGLFRRNTVGDMKVLRSPSKSPASGSGTRSPMQAVSPVSADSLGSLPGHPDQDLAAENASERSHRRTPSLKHTKSPVGEMDMIMARAPGLRGASVSPVGRKSSTDSPSQSGMDDDGVEEDSEDSSSSEAIVYTSREQ